MSGLGRHKDDYGRSSGSSHSNEGEETCARTRPFSFDEIMIRRKMKKLADIDGTDALGDAVLKYKSETVDGHDKASSSGVLESPLPEQVRSSSMPKAEKSLVKDEYLVGGKSREIQPVALTETRSQDNRKVHVREKVDDQLSRDSAKKERYVGGRRVQYERTDDADRRKSQKRPFGGSGTETAKKPRDLVEISRRVDGSRGRLKKDLEKTDRSRENGRGSERVSANEVLQNLSRDYMQKDRHVDSTRRKIENRSKPRDEVQDLVKKQDAAEGFCLDASDRVGRKEFSKSHYRESNLKRRRSRSREHKKINRSSASMSLRTQKHESFGLGGYSPRKRKSEAAVKTPPPTKRSPEKKSAKWDRAPKGKKETLSASIHANDLLSNQHSSSIMREVVNTVPISSDPGPSLLGASASSLLKTKNIPIESVQLTQSTRPIRRLYVENVPASASEKAVMDFLSNSLISYGVNHVPGTQPCISCIINKEKGQALVEFLTPEDASAALSFDGWSFSGCTIKIRRPKDYVEVATGEAQKSVAMIQAITDVVMDSPHKLFIGGIPNVLSSKMLMEIASAFGNLKGYQFVNNEECDGQRAFLEYADQNVTLKACAGLNGMKIGGQVLTAVQAVPEASVLGRNRSQVFHGIPEHAKPLLEKPTEVLKLMNIFKAEVLPSMSDPEIEEVLEDVRVECARFGAVKSINVIRHTVIHDTGTCSGSDTFVSGKGQEDLKTETNSATEADKDDSCVGAEGTESINVHDDPREPLEQSCISETETDCTAREVIAGATVETKTEKGDACCNDSSPTSPDGQKGEQDVESEGSYEIGSVLVEFTRTEACCMAAHCLHGRSFDDCKVTAEYVPLVVYKAKF
ncbi:Splicing factor U2AF 65 kDa subunit [Linum grandiflorum]